MNGFMSTLQQHMTAVEEIGNKIERGGEYLQSLQEYLPSLNQIITTIFGLMNNPELSMEMDPDFVLRVLADLNYGIEHKDSVFTLDVLMYGLLEIYDYIMAELQGGS